jgi:SWI/SNF-related matrix-associated actin-dependent regulator 1 of chromatin subfamily A
MAGVLIADEMGLGKSVQALAVLAAADAFPAAVVCPASLKLNWVREARSWLPNRTAVIVGGVRPHHLPTADLLVVNYDVLDAWGDHLGDLAAVVFDESHYLKNGSTLRTKAAIKLSDRLAEDAVRLCLSGTPVVNHPDELITQLRVLHRLDEFGGAREFRRRYAGGSNLAELNRRLRATAYLRRRKIDVLDELPPKRWASIIIEGDEEIMRQYRKAEKDIVTFLAERARQAALDAGATSEEAARLAWEQSLRASAAEHLVAITALKRLATEAKRQAIDEWIKDFVSSGSKLVIFAHHKEYVDRLSAKFAQGLRITGDVTNAQRHSAVERFQKDPTRPVIACSIRAAGVGLTLTAASDVLFVEQDWTPAGMDQAADRCHRIGQKDSVTAWVAICADTIDEDIAELIAAKRMVVDAATDGADADGEAGSVLGELLIRLAQRGL